MGTASNSAHYSFPGRFMASAMGQSSASDGPLYHLLMKKSTNRKAKLPVFFLQVLCSHPLVLPWS